MVNVWEYSRVKEKAGLYIHIPFCASECGYCAFAKLEDTEELKRQRSIFLKSIRTELGFQYNRFSKNLDFNTLYIGGGTPSLLSISETEELFESVYEITGQKFEEISFDCNPEDLVDDNDYVKCLEQSGVNRLTIGVQTLSDKGLKVLERKANQQNIIRMAESLPKTFKGQISYDIILGWPDQNLEDFIEHDEPFLKNFIYDHLSLYLLNYEPGTRLNRDIKHGKLNKLNEDTCANIWEHCLKVVRESGMEQYEISSFCKNNKQSIHNVGTWKGQPYLGIGPGAVSRVASERWTNTKSLSRYLSNIQNAGSSIEDTEVITATIAWQDELIFSMRYKEGINRNEFISKHGFDLCEKIKSSIKIGVEEGHLLNVNNRLKFTPLGWNFFDAYISDWMLIIE
jgi:oxygen-independent coproporphyrinogen-3 oxidase